MAAETAALEDSSCNDNVPHVLLLDRPIPDSFLFFNDQIFCWMSKYKGCFELYLAFISTRPHGMTCDHFSLKQRVPLATVLTNLIDIELYLDSAKSIPPDSALRPSSRAFILSSCKKTLYKDLCVRSLTRFAPNNRELSSHDLAHIALTVSLVKARYTRAYVLYVSNKLKASKRDGQAVQDCLSQITDGVDYLTQSIRELRHIAKSGTQDDFNWCSSNIETWLSSVLTNAVTCLDEFPGHVILTGKTKAIVKAKVVNVAEASSNALALFHRFADKYRSSNRWIKKSP